MYRKLNSLSMPCKTYLKFIICLHIYPYTRTQPSKVNRYHTLLPARRLKQNLTLSNTNFVSRWYVLFFNLCCERIETGHYSLQTLFLCLGNRIYELIFFQCKGMQVYILQTVWMRQYMNQNLHICRYLSYTKINENILSCFSRYAAPKYSLQ